MKVVVLPHIDLKKDISTLCLLWGLHQRLRRAGCLAGPLLPFSSSFCLEQNDLRNHLIALKGLLWLMFSINIRNCVQSGLCWPSQSPLSLLFLYRLDHSPFTALRPFPPLAVIFPICCRSWSFLSQLFICVIEISIYSLSPRCLLFEMSSVCGSQGWALFSQALLSCSSYPLWRNLLLLLFSHQVMSNSLLPHGLQCTRLHSPSPSPRVCPS